MSKIMKQTLAVLAVAAICLPAMAADITVSNDIVGVDVTWVGTNVYTMTQPIFVRDGATLTIEAGTVIRGEKEVTTDPGALIISQGSQIFANGTQSDPIIMTDINDGNVDGAIDPTGTNVYFQARNGISREWGGLIVLGETFLASDEYAPGTNSPSSDITLQIEGLEPYGNASIYGGGNDDDDSGVIQYVSIRYGGFVLGDANEINGLTMGAVGRNTTIDHVEVYQNKDDGFEWFGGTVNTKCLIAYAVGDDSFDWDEGFRGKGQFWLCVQGVQAVEGDKSDKAAEMDGADGDSSIPAAIPTVYNATLVGHGKDRGTSNTALHFRDGTGGRWFNTIIADFGGAPALIEGDVGGGYDSADNTQPGALYTTNAYYTHETGGTRKLQFDEVIVWKCFTNQPVAIAANTNGDAAAWGAEHKPTDAKPKFDGNKPHYGMPIYNGLIPQNNNTSLADGVSVFAAFTRVTTPVVISGKNYYPVQTLDPTLTGVGFFLNTRSQPNDGFFNKAAFRGAFGKFNWAAPWSTAFQLGELSNLGGGITDPGAPIVDAKVNGSDGPTVVVGAGSNATITAQIQADLYAGPQVDYWLQVTSPSAKTYRYAVGNWFGTATPETAPTATAGLRDFSSTVFNATLPETGNWTLLLGYDDNPDGNRTGGDETLYSDTITITQN